MDKWKSWSHMDLNIAIARSQGMNVEKRTAGIGNIYVVVSKSGTVSMVPDYCGSWDTSMMLYIDSGIIIGEYADTGEYMAISGSVIDEEHCICSDNITYLHDNPLIACAIVYLESAGITLY